MTFLYEKNKVCFSSIPCDLKNTCTYINFYRCNEHIFSYLFNYSFICLFTCLFIYLFIYLKLKKDDENLHLGINEYNHKLGNIEIQKNIRFFLKSNISAFIF